MFFRPVTKSRLFPLIRNEMTCRYLSKNTKLIVHQLNVKNSSEQKPTSYDEGFQAGLKAGEEIGYHRKRVETGYNEGYRLGYEKGFQEGQKAGFEKGKREGEQAGYINGLIQMTKHNSP